jgi:DNA-binding beta-propeller fold protein YncE
LSESASKRLANDRFFSTSGAPRASAPLRFRGLHAQSLNISTLAGARSGGGWVDAESLDARFSDPTGVAIEPSGTVVVADTGNHTIRRITFPAGITTTLAGAAGVQGFADGPFASARFRHPRGVAVDGAGVIYVADSYNHVIRRIQNGVVTTVAGQPGVAGAADGTGNTARFTFPYGLDIDPMTNDVIVADTENHTIRRGCEGFDFRFVGRPDDGSRSG